MKTTGLFTAAFPLIQGLFLIGCSSAELCEAGDGCAPFGISSADGGDAVESEASGGGSGVDPRYAAILEAECESLCSAFEGCGRTIFSDETRPCSEQCEEQSTRERYFNCEPVFRRYIVCMTSGADCHFDECAPSIVTYVECMAPEDELPPAANCCVLANNGVCNEPEECLMGSDTNDCGE